MKFGVGTNEPYAYDTEWNRIVGAMTDAHEFPLLPKHKNLHNLLKCASVLSKGHEKVCVGLYDIDRKIYLGEMSFTSGKFISISESFD